MSAISPRYAHVVDSPTSDSLTQRLGTRGNSDRDDVEKMSYDDSLNKASPSSPPPGASGSEPSSPPPCHVDRGSSGPPVATVRSNVDASRNGMNSLDTSTSSDDGNIVDVGSTTTTRDKARALFLFSACTVLLFADQNLMSPNLTAIAADLGFDERQRDAKLGGEIALAFWVLGAPASFVVGCLADAYHRPSLFAWTVGIGEGACLATFWASTYRQLFACRAVTGFALGGALPLIYSLLGDLFPPDQRHAANALVSIGTGFGVALGQGVAGFVGPSLGWRLPFLLVSVPALLCAASVLLFVPDPERGSMERSVRDRKFYRGRLRLGPDEEGRESENDAYRYHHGDDEREDAAGDGSTAEMTPLGRNASENGATPVSSHPYLPCETAFFASPYWTTFRTLLSTPTVLLSLAQGIPGCVPWGIVNTYLNDYLSENRGMSVKFATVTVLIFGLGTALGQIIGGASGSYLYRLDIRYPAILSGIMAIVGCLPFWALLNIVDSSTPIALLIVIAVPAGVACGVTGPVVKATVQNTTLPQSRGQAFAMFNTCDDFGRGLGPVFVAALIGAAGSRRRAFNAGVLGWVVCGALNLLMFFTVRRDERAVQDTLAARLDERSEHPPVASAAPG